jgi:hypothetical protein
VARSNTGKSVDAQFGKNRLIIGREYHTAANALVDEKAAGKIGNPVASAIVNAAIAYTDALTATFGSTVNQQDHQAAVKTLRSVMGNKLPKAQETRLTRILGNKDLAQYGGRFMTLDDAKNLLSQLDEFARWVESEMSSM